MNKPLSLLSGLAFTAALCLTAQADPVITTTTTSPVVTESTITTAPVAPAITESTTTTTAPVISHERTTTTTSRPETEKERDLRHDLKDARKDYKEKVDEAYKDANDD